MKHLSSPELSVDLQGFGQNLSPHVSHGVSTDVQFGQRGVAAQSVEDDGEVGLEFGISQGQRGQRLQMGTQRTHFECLKSKQDEFKALNTNLVFKVSYGFLFLNHMNQIVQDLSHIPVGNVTR